MKWFPRVLESIRKQSITPEKIIFVDDSSTDGSAQFAKKNGCQVINYSEKEFNYSKALNIGLKEVESDTALLLSAHCVLYGKFALEKLIEAQDLFSAAGVFGRQIPTQNSSDIDARDLLTVFGRERIIYEKYPFFHNAFSLIDMSVWNDTNFSTKVNGIEDRLWAYDVCAAGHKIIYEPSAIAYHEHGLNQGCCDSRAKRVFNALKILHKDDKAIVSDAF